MKFRIQESLMPEAYRLCAACGIDFVYVEDSLRGSGMVGEVAFPCATLTITPKPSRALLLKLRALERKSRVLEKQAGL